MIQLKIDPEFRDKIPPMTEEQFNGLREDILRDGYVRDPLVVWEEENTLLDGHHRWRIICENWEILKDNFNIVKMTFPDRWAALEWICRNQLNKHNLNDEQITYIRGEMYKARKKTEAFKGNQYTVQSGAGKNDRHQPERTESGRLVSKDGVAGVIAKELNIGERTVRNSEKFHDGVDELRKVSPEAAEKVMRGGSGVRKQDVMTFPTKSPEEQSKFASDVISGEVKKKQKNHHSQTKAEREAIKATEAIISDMYDTSSVPEYTLDFLIEDIQLNGNKYVDLLRNTLKDRNTLLTAENRPSIAAAIESIIIKIKYIKELVNA